MSVRKKEFKPRFWCFGASGVEHDMLPCTRQAKQDNAGGGTSVSWTIKQQTGSLVSKVRSTYAKPQDPLALSVKERAEIDASVSLISRT